MDGDRPRAVSRPASRAAGGSPQQTPRPPKSRAWGGGTLANAVLHHGPSRAAIPRPGRGQGGASQSGGLAIIRLCRKAFPDPLPRPAHPLEHVGVCGRGAKGASLPPAAFPVPGQLLGVGGRVAVPPPLTARGSCIVWLRVQASRAPADGFCLPSGHPGGERPAFRWSVRGKPVQPRCPAPELSESKPLSCLEEFSSLSSL